MRPFLPVLILCSLGLPAGVSAQSADSAPRVELGAVLTAFASPAGTGSVAFGPRVTANLTRQLGVQLDIRLPAMHLFQGLYGVRARYTPPDEDSLWYAFGGVAGAFAIPRVRHYEANGVRSSVRNGGFMTLPMMLNGGIGARLVTAERWTARLEGEAWTSTYGGFALAAGFEVAFGAARRR